MKKVDNNYVFTEEELLEYSIWVAKLQKAESYQEVGGILLGDGDEDETEEILFHDNPISKTLDYLYDDTNIFEKTETRDYQYHIDEVIEFIKEQKK